MLLIQSIRSAGKGSTLFVAGTFFFPTMTPTLNSLLPKFLSSIRVRHTFAPRLMGKLYRW